MASMDDKPNKEEKKRPMPKPRKKTRHEQMFDEFLERSKKARDREKGDGDSEKELRSELDDQSSLSTLSNLNSEMDAASALGVSKNKRKGKLANGEDEKSAPPDYNLYDNL